MLCFHMDRKGRCFVSAHRRKAHCDLAGLIGGTVCPVFGLAIKSKGVSIGDEIEISIDWKDVDPWWPRDHPIIP